ncbi:lactase-phlorizin hydrolase-like [Melitaea cinxia]|uniref:lactase-phlorizin hydrolase-like n=1 Tax=Melitaea cinxia TaxID=113334 RepID=UPI001E26F1A6|nr:lactase-phlorizin hydrolase-like [Melitaea cinxia]
MRLSTREQKFYGVCFCLAESKTTNRHEPRKFPDGMLFGTATSSYQVEGGWDADDIENIATISLEYEEIAGKTENIWDNLSHQKPCVIEDCHTGDIADNSYYSYKRDVEMLRELGVDFYRFSLSWARILPTSFPDKINEKGVEYYNNLINELLKYNIQPMVTIYHWDLPQKLQNLGGWINPLIVDWFTDYARVAFELFGDKVKYWFTINEPRSVCFHGYANERLAPLYNISGIAEYICYKNILLAHANAYHLYNNEYRSKINGTIGIVAYTSWFEPESEEHAEAAEDASKFEWGVFVDPIFSKKGDFPQVLKDRIAIKSLAQGFPRSRLPLFTPEEVELIKGSSDFYGLNHYSSYVVYRNDSVNGYYNSPSQLDDLGAVLYTNSTWESANNSWLKVVPWGFYKLLTKIREDYNNPPILITENGFSTRNGLEDDRRVAYYRDYLDAMLNAVEEGSDIRAYTAWSLMDNFEWMDGYGDRFGLYEVDYDSPERTRTPRKSAYVYKEIVRTRTLDYQYEPDMSLNTLSERRVPTTLMMIWLFHLIFYGVCFCLAENKTTNRHEPRKFPDGMLFGTATSSYQVEGGWNADGKTENIWDHLTHQKPCVIEDCHTGDIADNSYYSYKRDVEMLRELGVDFYRFSLSWARILPTSFPDKINEKGVEYYNNLINELLKYNIQPMVTIYHWDLPQKLQNLGGWTNPLIVDWFTDYARVAFELFGDKVKYWFTINEPRSWGIFVNPIFSKKGDFPEVFKDRIAIKSLAQGFPRSRLPLFTPEEVELIKGSSDFYGLNHYSAHVVYRNDSVNGYYDSPSQSDDLGVILYKNSTWESAHNSWLKAVPRGFYKLLTKIREDYDNPPILITENGFSTRNGLEDDRRVAYYRDYLDAMLDAVEEGSDIRAYTAWSLMDNFEWLDGYGDRFGLYEVDYDSPERTRTPRKSAYVYKEIVRTRTLDYQYEPDMSVPLSIDEGH